MAKLFATIALIASALLPAVSAHGFIRAVAIDGKTYPGNSPGNINKVASPIRTIADQSPLKGANNKDLSCGNGANTPAKQVAPANPGSRMTFQWATGNGNWVHNTGPLVTYLAACEGTTCDKFNSKNAKWFKIDEAGRKKDSMTWFQQDIMNGDSLTVTLPKNLKAGGYLVRHEIVALHLATNPGGAEFYPSCTQILVGGSGSGVPASTVTFPGGYSDNGAGILVPDVFSTKKYNFPGPQLDALSAKSAAITVPISANAKSTREFSRVMGSIFGDLASETEA